MADQPFGGGGQESFPTFGTGQDAFPAFGDGGDPFGAPPAGGDPFGQPAGGDPFGAPGGDDPFVAPAASFGGDTFPDAFPAAAQPALSRLPSQGTVASGTSSKSKKKKKSSRKNSGSAAASQIGEAFQEAFEALGEALGVEQPAATLNLRIRAARNLQPDPESGEVLSVFVNIRTAKGGTSVNQEFKTSTVASNLNPEWEDGNVFTISLAADEQDMQLEVVGVTQQGQEKSFGSAFVSFAEIPQNQVLDPTTLQTDGVGEIEIDVYLEVGQHGAAGGSSSDYAQEEREYYQKIFEKVDADNNGAVDAVAGAAFLRTSGLPDDVLQNVWELSDSTNRGNLNRDEFFEAMRLIAHYQADGSMPSRELALRQPSQLPDFAGLTFDRLPTPEHDAGRFEPQPSVGHDMPDPGAFSSAWAADEPFPAQVSGGSFNFPGDQPPAASEPDVTVTVTETVANMDGQGTVTITETERVTTIDVGKDPAVTVPPPTATKTLFLSIHAAYNLGSRDKALNRYTEFDHWEESIDDAPRPYVVATIPNRAYDGPPRVRKTEPASPSYNPLWVVVKEFTFFLEPKDNYLLLEVKSVNAKNKQRLNFGHCLVDLRGLSEGQWQRRRDPLRDGNRGELEYDVRLEMIDFAEPEKVGTPLTKSELREAKLDVFEKYLRAVRSADLDAISLVRREIDDLQEELSAVDDTYNAIEVEFKEMDNDNSSAIAEFRAIQADILMLQDQLKSHGGSSRTLDFNELEELQGLVHAYQAKEFLEMLMQYEKETTEKLRDVNDDLRKANKAIEDDTSVLKPLYDGVTAQMWKEERLLKAGERALNEAMVKKQRMERELVLEKWEIKETHTKEQRLKSLEKETRGNTWAPVIAVSSRANMSPASVSTATPTSPFGSPTAYPVLLSRPGM